MLRATSLALCSAVALAGCIAPPTPAQRLAESAYDLNTAARFGRMDVAIENVRDSSRETFSRTHAAWGKSVRIVDCEMSGFSMRQDGDADVFVTINWQRIDESTMRSTDLAQRWGTTRGMWRMIREEEKSGDRGLLRALAEEKKEQEAGDASAEPAGAGAFKPSVRSRYQTKTIYEQ